MNEEIFCRRARGRRLMGELTVTTFDIMDKLDEAASGPRFLSSGHNSKESTPAGDNFAGKVFLIGLTNTCREIRNKYVIAQSGEKLASLQQRSRPQHQLVPPQLHHHRLPRIRAGNVLKHLFKCITAKISLPFSRSFSLPKHGSMHCGISIWWPTNRISKFLRSWLESNTCSLAWHLKWDFLAT